MASARPPRAPRSGNVRVALLLNLFLPGTGQFYLGWRVLGGVLMLLFLGCFAGVLGLFLVDYAKYLKLVLGGDILQANRLEQASQVFQVRCLGGLLAAGLAIYLGALIHVSTCRANKSAAPDAKPTA